MCTLIWYSGFMGTFFFFFFFLLTYFNYLVVCLSMIVCAHAVLGVFYACVLYLHLLSATEHVSHGIRSRNMLIIRCPPREWKIRDCFTPLPYPSPPPLLRLSHAKLILQWLPYLAPGIVGSSSSVFPAISLGFTSYGEIFAYVTVFNPIIEVVTFRLRGWCMLGVFLLLAFTHLGHECEDLLKPSVEMHVCTD